MAFDNQAAAVSFEQAAEIAMRRTPADRAILDELVRVLAANPNGLRRWSVMRAIRKERDRTGREVPQKFEDEIERTFRRFCAVGDVEKPDAEIDPAALFFKPREKAGEVWALLPGRASYGEA
ncbi:MAG: hypothetical protein GC166_05845 [Alphaproteobacteria bacterium]|nr:hypothetical protein [Alphaproteobacteria bacterium]